ncbi:hypothetical protein [Psychromonas ingrahamii]|uniref:hypothetical protein n=1 Tax=Psychromonas ingrahamii TaxID=357794 RepID=UPI0000D81A9F|nr:hypothetical protein [Psychromonas ingrahamii]
MLSSALHLQTYYPVDLDEFSNSIHYNKGLTLSDSVCDYSNMIDNVVGNADVKIEHLRKDVYDAAGINLWMCAIISILVWQIMLLNFIKS